MVMIHATCVDLGGAAVLLRGPSGSGKSDLALRLIDIGARLVADDQVIIERQDGILAAKAPAQLEGKMEVRGLGILQVPSIPVARLALIVDLVLPAMIERLPDPAHETIEGCSLARVQITPFEASAVAKVRFALAASLAHTLGVA